MFGVRRKNSGGDVVFITSFYDCCLAVRDAALRLLFPPVCAVCGAAIPNEDEFLLCKNCLNEVRPVPPPVCSICGKPLGASFANGHRCGECILKPPVYERCISLFAFDGPVRELLHKIKYRDDGYALRAMSRLARAYLPANLSIELVIPVPLHSKRLRERGYNQCVNLAKFIFNDIPISYDGLKRRIYTQPQTSLERKQRLVNLKGAFNACLSQDFAKKRILLLDDVLTTGATVNECVLTLWKAGFRNITVLTVARAVKDF
ncbi:MAG: ComF family protein [Dissulfuribacterales bacterium]